MDANLCVSDLALGSGAANQADAARCRPVRDVDRGSRHACNGQRSGDRLLFDSGWPGAGEVARLALAPTQVIGDQFLDDAAVLAMDPHEQAQSSRCAHDLVKATIGGHEALFWESEKDLDPANPDSRN